jgi:membrane-associated protease RseP (regulator of RpoE activity)
MGYTPILRPASDNADTDDDVALHVLPGVTRKSRPRVWVNVVLFLATVVSTLFVGSLYGDNGLQAASLGELFLPQNLIKGLPFAAVLLGILTAHEFGHYFAARYHNVAVTLPYFIPVPLPGGFGTLGAFIQLREPVPDRRKLFDIGVAGPLAGFVLAVPLLLVGLATSPVQALPPPPFIMEGNSILYFLAKLLVLGQILPNPITGHDVLMNQVTYAAWTGLLVTALNLLPVGQLDGGHTVYALFGRSARYINIVTTILMAILAFAGLEPLQRMFPSLVSIGFSGWFVWLGLILFVIRPFHPPALDDVTSLDKRRRLVGYLVIVLFLLTFPPVPLRVVF